MEATDLNVIRQTIKDCIEPLATDMTSVRRDLERLANDQAQLRSEVTKSFYSREYMDLALGKLKEENAALRTELSAVKAAVGAFWHQTALKVGLLLTLLAQIVTVVHLLWPN